MTETKKYVWRAGLAIAVVGAVSVGAIGIASASSDDNDNIQAAAQPTSTPDNDTDGNPWHGGPWGGGRGGGPWGGFGGFGNLDDVLGANVTDLLHGEVVLAKEGGGTQTVSVHKGAVTDVNATTVTVKSSDGYTKSYAVNGDTKVKADKDEIASVAKDEQVVVVSPKSGDKQTATVLVDLTDLGWK